MNTPKMRTIAEAAAELKKYDPNSALTQYAIRQMVLNGEIPHIKVGTKRLINMEVLLEHLKTPAKITKGGVLNG